MILHLLSRGDDAPALEAIRRMGASRVAVLSGPSPSLPPEIEVERWGDGGIGACELLDRIESADRVYCW